MQQTFIRIVQGHTLEFNRLLFPTRYSIIPQDISQAGTVISVEKDDQKLWYVKSLSQLPGWVSEITKGIFDVIAENESKPAVQ